MVKDSFPRYKFPSRVIGVDGGVFDGKPWLSVELRIDGRIARFKVNNSLLTEVSSFLDKDVSVECELIVFSGKPILRICSLAIIK